MEIQNLIIWKFWIFWIWNGSFWSETKILDLIWKFWIWYGSSRFEMGSSGSDMEVPNLNREFLIWYGSSGSEKEFLDLIWNFQIWILAPIWKQQIWYGNSRSDMKVCNFLNLKWKFLIRNENCGSDMGILDLIWKFWIWYGNSRS